MCLYLYRNCKNLQGVKTKQLTPIDDLKTMDAYESCKIIFNLKKLDYLEYILMVEDSTKNLQTEINSKNTPTTASISNAIRGNYALMLRAFNCNNDNLKSEYYSNRRIVSYFCMKYLLENVEKFQVKTNEKGQEQ